MGQMMKKPNVAGRLIGALALLLFSTLVSSAPSADSIRLYIWSDYIPRELLKKFEAETKIRVLVQTYDSNETLLAQLQGGSKAFDVVVPSDYMVKILIDQALLRKVNAASMPNFQFVGKPFDKPLYDPGRDYSVPYMRGTTGYVVDAARAPQAAWDSWKYFFDPPAALKGQVVALDDMNELYIAAALFLRVDQCSTSDRDHKKILDLLLRQKPFLAMYSSDGAIQRMQAREALVHQIWDGAGFRVRQKLKSAVYVFPKEGLNFWSDNLAIPRNAANPEAALKFLNWMMVPENIAMASKYTGYNNAVPASLRLLPTDMQQDPAVNPPPSVQSRFVPNQLCSEKSLELRKRVWAALKKQ